MEIFETIKKFLEEGGKCLLIEDGQPVGVVLTMEEYELLRNQSQISNLKSPAYAEASAGRQKEETKPEANLLSQTSSVSNHPIGEAMIKEMDFPSASANLDEINLADEGDVTLEDLGLDELPY